MSLRSTSRAFTIVEIIVVIAVLGILASISVVGYGAWRNRVAESEVKSDLQGAKSAMESARTWNNGYPTAPTFDGIGALFQQSANVTLSYAKGTTTDYCINGVSKGRPSIVYYLNSAESTEPQKGTCGLVAPGAPTITTISPTSLRATWTKPEGATNATLQWSTQANFPTASSYTNANTSVQYPVSSLAQNTTYYFRLSYKDSAGVQSPYSAVVSAKTPVASWLMTITEGTNTCGSGCSAAIDSSMLYNGQRTGTFVADQEVTLPAQFGCSSITVSDCGTVSTRLLSPFGAQIKLDNGTWGLDVTRQTTVSAGGNGLSVFVLRVPVSITASPITISVSMTAGRSGTVLTSPTQTIRLDKQW